jgi:hypothetical protein
MHLSHYCKDILHTDAKNLVNKTGGYFRLDYQGQGSFCSASRADRPQSPPNSSQGAEGKAHRHPSLSVKVKKSRLTSMSITDILLSTDEKMFRPRRQGNLDARPLLHLHSTTPKNFMRRAEFEFAIWMIERPQESANKTRKPFRGNSIDVTYPYLRCLRQWRWRCSG